MNPGTSVQRTGTSMTTASWKPSRHASPTATGTATSQLSYEECPTANEQQLYLLDAAHCIGCLEYPRNSQGPPDVPSSASLRSRF